MPALFWYLIHSMLGKFFIFCHLLHCKFAKINAFKNSFRNMIRSSECQTVLIKIRSDVLLGLISVQTVCKSYQQFAIASKELMHLYATSIGSNFLYKLDNVNPLYTGNPYMATLANNKDPDEMQCSECYILSVCTVYYD